MSVTLEVSEALIAAVSPKISIIENAAGFTITIQDVLGTKTIDIKNGKDGDPGEQGEKGNGIEGAKFNDDYSLTLNYTNGETYTTPSLKGKDGIGIVGIELRESVPDEYDTYAIVLDDGNETLFKVPNVTIDGYLVKIEDKKNEAITEIENLKESIPSDYTEMSGRVEKAESDVTELKGDLEQLKQNGTGTGTGLPTEAIDKLEEVGNYLAYTTADGGSKWTELISILRNGSSGGDSGETVPATGIILNKTTLSFTDSATHTLIATVEPSNSTDSVTWESSNTGIATVKNGVVTPVSNGSCTITAKAGSYSANCAVTVSIEGEIVTLTSISATYTGGNVAVGTSLSDLTDITVTATYSDGSTANVTDYTLSGTIEEGINTITVSYGGKTTTFIVVGYAEQEGPNTPPTGNTEPVYELAQAITFDGTNYVDTGYILNDVDKDWSILTDFTPTVTTSGAVFNASKNANNLGVRVDGGGNGFGVTVCGKGTKIKYSQYANNNVKAVIIREKDSDKINTYCITGKVNFMSESEATGVGYATNQHNLGNNIPLTLGKNAFADSNYYKGTINQFEIYERVLTSEEIDTFIGATWEAPSEPTNLIDINTCTLGGNMPDGRKFSEDYYVTDFIPVAYGNPYYANITKYISYSATDNGQYFYVFNQSKQYKKAMNLVENLAMGENFDLTSAIIDQDEIAYVRLAFHKNYKDIAFFGEGLV